MRSSSSLGWQFCHKFCPSGVRAPVGLRPQAPTAGYRVAVSMGSWCRSVLRGWDESRKINKSASPLPPFPFVPSTRQGLYLYAQSATPRSSRSWRCLVAAPGAFGLAPRGDLVLAYALPSPARQPPPALPLHACVHALFGRMVVDLNSPVNGWRAHLVDSLTPGPTDTTN